MDQCLHSNLFFREEKKKHLSDDKLLKNDINVAGEDNAVVLLQMDLEYSKALNILEI